MTKQDLIDRVHLTALSSKKGNPKLTKSDVAAVLDALTFEATAELHTGGEVTLPGLGKLTVKARAAKKGRNPSTGEEIDIPAKTVPHFSAAKALKDAVNG